MKSSGETPNASPRVSAAVALTLGEAFGVSPEDFMHLQTSYSLAVARITTKPDPGRVTRAQLFGGLPISEMMKRGWIESRDIRDTHAIEASLTVFFEAA